MWIVPFPHQSIVDWLHVCMCSLLESYSLLCHPLWQGIITEALLSVLCLRKVAAFSSLQTANHFRFCFYGHLLHLLRVVEVLYHRRFCFSAPYIGYTTSFGLILLCFEGLDIRFYLLLSIFFSPCCSLDSNRAVCFLQLQYFLEIEVIRMPSGICFGYAVKVWYCWL